MTELLPTKAAYLVGESVEIEVHGASAATEAVVYHLGDEVARIAITDAALIRLPALQPGGYRVELGTATTAIEVTDSVRDRLRYGFVVDYSPHRDVAAVGDLVRRLHLTGVQFYDWAYRHAGLLAGGEDYHDALGQPVSLDTVRRLVDTVRAAGSRSFGYAAVYAVGPDEWPLWKHDALLAAGGTPYGLGDFLFLVDPAAPDWLEHFTTELRSSIASVGFDGFHLDQYGYPKIALRADGEVVDVAESFATLIDATRAALPEAHLVFNNVNDFPTWGTAALAQDAVYIEPWDPQVTLGSLARVADRARSVAEGKPVVMAAYQHVYATADAAASDRATRLTMATLFSHGATQLLAGEADRILVDPYYVRNHVVEDSTAAMLVRWYDFLVEHDELLMSPEIVDVTASFAGRYNDDADVAFDAASLSSEALAGSVWRRITRAGDHLVIHLINLVGQDDTLWDSARLPFADPGEATLRLRAVGGFVPRVRVADPDNGGRLSDVSVTVDGDYASAALPKLEAWQIVVVELAPR